MALFPVAWHKTGTMSLSPSEPPLKPLDLSYYNIPVQRGPFQGGRDPAPLRVRKFQIPDIRSGGSPLPQESLPCTARGGARSGSGVWCASSTALPAPYWTHNEPGRSREGFTLIDTMFDIYSMEISVGGLSKSTNFIMSENNILGSRMIEISIFRLKILV